MKVAVLLPTSRQQNDYPPFGRFQLLISMKYITLFFLIFILGCGNDTSRQEEAPDGGLSQEETQQYLDRGAEVVGLVGSTLIGKLKGVLESGVPIDSAVRYCNTIAYPLVDTLAGDKAVKVKRVSEKYRNPLDRPSPQESAILADFNKYTETEQSIPDPILKPVDANTIGYYQPIMTMKLCLNCHGVVGEDVKTEHYEVIKELYPQDKAVGYQEGNLRGMWVVYLKKI